MEKSSIGAPCIWRPMGTTSESPAAAPSRCQPSLPWAAFALPAAVSSTGQAGLERFRSGSIDVVLSDIHLPGISGYELCRQIKADPAAKDVPIILLTSLNDVGDILRGLEAGADNFIAKPYEAEHLLSRVHNVRANKAIRADRNVRVGLDLFFQGKKFAVTSDIEQILDFLLSTFD